VARSADAVPDVRSRAEVIRTFLLILAFLSACGDTTPISDTPLSIRAAVREVALGQAFPLTVVRTWRKDAAPDWSDAALSPLRVRLLETSRREDSKRVEETREYEAYAFTLDGVRDVSVRRALDPAAPGPAELPDLPDPFAWWPVALGLAAAALLLYRRRRPPPPAVEEVVQAPPAPPAPHMRALDRIRQLRGNQDECFYSEATALLRDYIAERFAVNATVMTTEELIARHATLGDVLRHCDLVQFARHRSTAQDRDRVLDTAEAFVRETTA